MKINTELQTNTVEQNNNRGLFARVRAINKFWGCRLAELQKLAKATMRLGFSCPLIKFWFFSWSTQALLYPALRIALGREKSFQICNHFFKKKLEPQIFSLPVLMKSKILIKEKCDYFVLTEIYLEDTYHKDIIKNGMNIVDVGAHIGAYTILAAEKVGDTGRVVAIEPEPKNYKQLTENIEINNFRNIIPVKMALSDHSGSEKLYIGSLSGHHSLKPRFLFHPKNNPPFIKVKVDTLDELLERLSFKKIDVIKIDTEGMEMPILRGAEKTLKNNPGAKIIVASYHYPGETEEVQNFLRNMGFESKISPFNIVITI